MSQLELKQTQYQNPEYVSIHEDFKKLVYTYKKQQVQIKDTFELEDGLGGKKITKLKPSMYL